MTTRTLVLCSALALLQSGLPTQAATSTWAKPDHFWYRRGVPGGNLWLTVDAQHAVREPLFDHQRLAIELNLRTGAEYTPLTLPFADPAAQFVVKYDGSNAYIQAGAMAIEFVLAGDYWRCELEIKWNWNKVPPTDYECLSRGPVALGQPAGAVNLDAATPVVSPDGRRQAFVRDHNVAIGPVGSQAVRPTVLSSDGSATYAYQAGSIRWSDSTTLTAYRVSEQVWLSESVSGSVKDQVAKGQWSVR